MRKPLLLLFLATSVFLGCNAKSSAKVDFDADDIQFHINPETGNCYGVVGVLKGSWYTALGGKAGASGIGMTGVECTDLVLTQIDSVQIDSARKLGTLPQTFKLGN